MSGMDRTFWDNSGQHLNRNFRYVRLPLAICRIMLRILTHTFVSREVLALLYSMPATLKGTSRSRSCQSDPAAASNPYVATNAATQPYSVVGSPTAEMTGPTSKA
ncbi:hypothetical protein Vretimale_887 [Volvox reticuliferus]|uniref:Uncharacterized protein n=1 Tax=Volvox reticuliferus TaxID=1737510 RepID=A0A8J4D7X9_9CHLO|nr:hypothetical protein Vretimale_887 [Volvox reticuliferus]